MIKYLLAGIAAVLTLGSEAGYSAREAVLFSPIGKTLVSSLERNGYGSGGASALIGIDSAVAIFRPSTAQDHLSTPFIAVPHRFLQRSLLVLRTTGVKDSSSLTMRLQDQDYEQLVACVPECSTFVGFGTKSVRIVFGSKDLVPAELPASVTLTAVYTWDSSLIVAMASAVLLSVAVIVVFTLWKRRLKAFSERFSALRSEYRVAAERRRYWIGAILLVAAYGAIWGANFKYVYGWFEDDWATYYKALGTIQDPKNAFLVRANLLQPYFFLFSYLPLAAGLRVPSIEIPTYGSNTGLLRGLLLYSTCYHLGIALTWAWFAEKLCLRKSAAWLSLLFLLASPTFVLWTPQPDSRLVGLPLVLFGIWLLTKRPVPSLRGAFFAGLLFSLANNLHYTSMYLTIPAAIVLCCVDLLARWNGRLFWTTWMCFALGAGSLIAGLELASHYWIGLPVSQGPVQFLLAESQRHKSSLTGAQTLLVWGGFARSLIGIPMAMAAVAGMAVWARSRRAAGPDSILKTAFLLIFGLGLVWVLTSGSNPYFRQTSLLQPFLFLFAATAVTEAAGLVKRPAPRLTLLTMLTLAAVAIPASQAYKVFQAHLGFGKVIRWVESNRKERRICWMIKRVAEYSPAEYLETFSGDDWLVMYFSSWSNDLAEPLSKLRPLTSGPGLWRTSAIYAETNGGNGPDTMGDPALDTRVYRIADVTAALEGWKPSSPDTSDLEVSRLEIIPGIEFAETPASLMTRFRPYPDPAQGKKVRVFGKRLGFHSVLVANGVPLPTRVDDFHTDAVGLIAILPREFSNTCIEAFVQDGARRSNSARLCLP